MLTLWNVCMSKMSMLLCLTRGKVSKKETHFRYFLYVTLNFKKKKNRWKDLTFSYFLYLANNISKPKVPAEKKKICVWLSLSRSLYFWVFSSFFEQYSSLFIITMSLLRLFTTKTVFSSTNPIRSFSSATGKFLDTIKRKKFFFFYAVILTHGYCFDIALFHGKKVSRGDG